MGARGGAVGWGTALQAGRSQVWFPMVTLEFFIDIILPATLWPWGRLSLLQKWIKISPTTGQDRPWGFQEVEAPRFQDSRHMNVVRLSAVCTGRLYSQVIFLVHISVRETRRIISMKNSNDTIGNRTRNLPTCSERASTNCATACRQQKWILGIFPGGEGGKGGRCVGLTTSPPSCADCLEIWEPQPPGSLRVCPGL